jgi:hypothetical protein
LMGAIPRLRSVVGAVVSRLVESSSFALFAGGPSIGALSEPLVVVSYIRALVNGYVCLRGCEKGDYRIPPHCCDSGQSNENRPREKLVQSIFTQRNSAIRIAIGCAQTQQHY